MLQKIFVDFNNCDKEGRVRLNTAGTIEDLERLNIALESGMELLLDDGEELSATGIVQYSEEENIWVAAIKQVNT